MVLLHVFCDDKRAAHSNSPKTKIPQIHADRIANAFTSETGIEVNVVRNSTFIVRERLMAEIGNGKTEADVVTIADVGTFVELKNRGHLMKYETWYVKVSKTVATAAILKLLIGPNSSADHPKIMSIQYKT